MTSDNVIQEIEELRSTGLEAIESAESGPQLEDVRVRFLGRKSRLNTILRGLKDLPPDVRGRAGKAGNVTRKELEAAIETGRERFKPKKAAEDPTLPGVRPSRGHAHLITQTMDDLLDIFHGMGFSVARGPDVEDDYHNFEALNLPKDHPARDMHDTFFISEEVLLRTHTSPVQIRMMKATPPPIRTVFPGRVYRRETPDATHSSEFHQLEVLYVDHGVTMRDLKGALTYVARQIFGESLAVRFRPSYFPFVEPGAEVDIECFQCLGKGCGLCKKSGWIEILGSGMVHPEVFRQVGYDPDEVSGYAAGMGIERIAMLRHGIPDIRLFYENDLRFLTQF